jgi:ADP-ribose pyrophosphatase YjhB (NUDIX family)
VGGADGAHASAEHASAVTGAKDESSGVGAGEAGPRVPRWLDWARTLQSVGQAGLTYARDPFDRERYREVRRVAAQIAAAGTSADPDVIEGFFASQHGYPTPKIDVRAAVIVEHRILLVHERDDGAWSLPGGWADVGESAAETAERETREEAGVEVRAVKLLALYDRERRGHPRHPEYSYKAIFACQAEGSGSPRPGYETLGAGFFARDELPELSLARVLPDQIALAFAHAANPSLPTAFD